MNGFQRGQGNSVPSSADESRWSGEAGDTAAGGWNGGHDQGKPRDQGSGEGKVETGVSGDSVRGQGIQSATSSPLGSQGAGATSGGPRKLPGPGKGAPAEEGTIRREDPKLGWDGEGQSYPRARSGRDGDS